MFKKVRLSSNKFLRYLLLLSITVVVLISLATAIRVGFASRSFKTTNGTNQVNLTDATQGWKTYTDTNDSFSIRYPPTWDVEYSDADDPHWVTLFSPDFEETDNFAVIRGQKVTVNIFPAEDSNSYLYSGSSGDSDEPNLVDTHIFTLQGIDASQKTFRNVLGEYGDLIVISFTVGERLFSIDCHSSGDMNIDVKKVCDSIISTMQFQP